MSYLPYLSNNTETDKICPLPDEPATGLKKSHPGMAFFKKWLTQV
jgi:hypothetical protein